MRKSLSNSGFTMIELVIVVGILGVLVSLALPNFSAMSARISANSAAKSMASAINLARSEAIKRGLTIGICSSSNGTSCVNDEWNSGWIVYVNGTAEVVKTYDPLATVNVTYSGGNTLWYNSRGYGANGGVVTFDMCPEDNNAENARQIQVGISGRARLIEGVGC